MKEDHNEFSPENQMGSGGAEETSARQPAGSGAGESILSRRIFIGKVGKVVALGALVHFKLLGSKALAVFDECCSGGGGDICNPPTYKDDCPGGTVSVDDCNLTNPPAEDECYNGLDPDDKCSPGGGKSEDSCYGGGSKPGVPDQDNCDGGQGDECTSPDPSFPVGGGHDNCKGYQEGNATDMCDTDIQDTCGYVPLPGGWSDDTCPDGGTNPSTGDGQGGGDLCLGDQRASDACYDGSAAQDLCIGDQNGDLCLGMVNGEQTDECPSYKPPEDECSAVCSGSEDRCDPMATVPDV